MTLVHMSELFKESSGALAAFNVVSLEHAEGVIVGAERARRPVILQLSENAIAYHGSPFAIARAMVEVSRDADVEVALHLDHITDRDLMFLAPELGFSSVMFDGSKHDFETNCNLTREAADWGGSAGIWVEAELGEIGGKSGPHEPGVRTDPAEAQAFVEETQVDSLAVAVGSSHAMVNQTARLDLNLIERIDARVPVPLVLHGSSGVPDVALAGAVTAGMAKINIGTALNVAFTGAVRNALNTDSRLSDPRKYLASSREAVASSVSHYLELLSDAANDSTESQSRLELSTRE